MIQVSLKMGNDDTGFRVLVQAESIKQAVNLMAEQYPGSEVRLLFPIDPEYFFIGDQGLAGAPASSGIPGEKAE